MTRGVPLKSLAALTVVVVAAHFALLEAGPLSAPALAPPAHLTAQVFVTRTLANPPEPPPLASPVKPKAAAKPAPRPAVRPTPLAMPAPAALVEPVAADPTPAAPVDDAPTLLPTETPPVDSDGAQADKPNAPVTAVETEIPLLSTAKVPGSALLRYEVASNKLPFTVNGVFNWMQNGSTYEAQLSYSAFGFSRSQSSRGTVGATGLAPERFADKLRNEVAAHFNYAAQKVTFSANTPDVVLLQGAQDRLSVLIQLGAQMASAPERYPEGTTLSFQTVGPRDAALWLFTVQGLETLTLPGGEMPAIKLVRNPRQDYDQKVELWLAPSLGYLPARIRITEQNGDAIDQKWLSSEFPV